MKRVSGGWLLTLMVGCTFDASDLHLKTACVNSVDCLQGRVCVAERCVDEGQGLPEDVSQDVEPDNTPEPFPDPMPDPIPDVPQRDVPMDEPEEPDIPAEEDFDEDGVPNGVDNCLDVPNPDQEDFDGNGVGEHCQRPERAGLVLTEVRRAPLFLQDVERPWKGQFIEIHNRTQGPVDLNGFVLSSGPQRVVISGTEPVEPGGFAVLSGGGLPGPQGDVTDFVYGRDIILPREGPGEVRLTREVDGQEILYDGLSWDEGWGWLEGTSLSLHNIGVEPDDNNLVTAWCPTGVSLIAGADGGSPGLAHGRCVPSPRALCGEAPLIEGDVVLWGRTDTSGPASLFHFFRCDNSGLPFDGRYSNESVWGVIPPRASRLTVRLDVHGDFGGLVYLRSGCDVSRFSEELACGIASSRDAPASVEINLSEGASYHLFVDGDDEGLQSGEASGVFTLDVSLR